MANSVNIPISLSLQSEDIVKEYKQVFICLLTGLLTNALLNIPLL